MGESQDLGIGEALSLLADAVVIGTPIDLGRIINISKPHTRVYYDLEEIGDPNLGDILASFAADQGLV